MKHARIAIFASGSGTNAEKIIQYFQAHDTIEVVLLLSNNPRALALDRARQLKVETVVFSRDEFTHGELILAALKARAVTHIVLAGFLWLIPAYLLKAFPDRIVNIHPALLPKYGGKGMYGIKVHQAVRLAGEVETGITIHIVNEQYDKGQVLFQTSCPVDEAQTPEDIAACVHVLEHEYYPRIIESWILQKPL